MKRLVKPEGSVMLRSEHMRSRRGLPGFETGVHGIFEMGRSGPAVIVVMGVRMVSSIRFGATRSCISTSNSLSKLGRWESIGQRA